MTKIKLIGIAVAILAIFGGGWKACSWYRDSIDLAEKKASDKAIEAFERRESQIAKDVNDKLASLKANERTRILKVPEIIKQPEFRNVCISEDGVASINSALRELYDSNEQK